MLEHIKDSLPELRDYQKIMYDARKASKENLLLCAPTGAGKGNIIAKQLLDNIRDTRSTIIIVPSEELIVNLEERIKRHFGLIASIVKYSGGNRSKNFDSPFLVTTYQSLYKQLDNCLDYQEVITDEAHLSSAETFLACLQRFPNAVHTGYSATPRRLDNKPLNYVYTDLINCPVSTRELINRGHLADFEVYGLPIDGFIDAYVNRDRSVDDGLGFQQKYLTNHSISNQIYDSWANIAYGKPTIGFASGKLHAEALTELFNDRYGSVKRFAYMHNGMKYQDRKIVLEALKSQDLLGVFNIQMLCMGVDVPHAEVALLCRKTKSDSLHRQMMGRVLRPKKNKSKGIFLDFVGNIQDLGSPTFPKEYTLDSDPDEQVSNPIIDCPHCFVPIATRSKLIKEIKNFKVTGNLSERFKSISFPKDREKRFGNVIENYQEYNTVIYCDNCERTFNRKFEVYLQISDGLRELKEIDDLGALELINHEQLDEQLLDKGIDRILNNKTSIQQKRKRILSGNFSYAQQFRALLKLGESKESAQLYLGEDEDQKIVV